MAPINNSKNSNNPKKQTGTVPKLSSIMMHSSSNNLVKDLGIFSQTSTSSLASPPPQLIQRQHQKQPLSSQQHQQKPLTTTNVTTTSNKAKPNTSYRSGTSRKNTEVVAPTRRELKDFNDYLLITSVNSDPIKQQNNNQSNNSGSSGQNHITGINDTIEQNGQQQLDSTCYDIENINFQENQRFCYPVRPIPRRSANKKHQQSQQKNNLHGEQNINISNTSTTSAAVGVVIPTTPGNSTIVTTSAPLLTEDHYNLLGNNKNRVSSNTTYQNILCDQQQIVSGNGNNSINHLSTDINSELTWEERLNFIQYFLSVTSKLNNQKDIIEQFNMVNETNGESKIDEVIVNSTSLEDVAQSETSDRAHSVSSIHTLSGAEPSTPNYEELQHRLESSNRNIQNIKDQQQQLLRLQEAAKEHLSEMEQVRNQMPIRFVAGGSTNGSNENGGAPDYESVEQVHNDMSALVNRMKNLQTFIQNQNELSVLLGEDSPDLLAEQELLQRKLNELKSHRTEMRNLVDELQNINTNAEKTISQQQQQQQQHQQQQQQQQEQQVNGNHHSENHIPVIMNGIAAGTPTRVVPVEYQRVVPIELVGASKKPISTISNSLLQQNGHTDTEDDNDIDNDEMDPETANMIKQKVADITAMKKQLQRLKDMMATVKLIEEKTEGPSVKDIGREPAQSNINRNSKKAPIEVPVSLQKDFTKNVKNAFENHDDDQTAEEAAMSERVRLLHEMTDDLRNQAMSLTSERDRLKSLREELKRRDSEVNEKNNSSNKESEQSLSAMNNTMQQNNTAKLEQNTLEAEYEEKKKEFQRLCESLQSEEEQNDETATVTGNEDNEDLDDDTNNETVKQEINFYRSNINRNANSTSCNSSVNQEKNCSTSAVVTSTAANIINTSNRGKDSADSGAADVHGNGVTASLEAGSMQSGSSRSFSMPPPMRSINNPVWRKNSHEHAHPHASQIHGCEHFIPGTWNPYPYQHPYTYPHIGSCGQPNTNGEYTFPIAGWNNLGMNTSNSTNTNPVPTNDPVLLQQFIQTQQMLINSVCQCNQMLWHQQREINNLNNTVVLLHERIMNTAPDLLSLQNNRPESVPPLSQNNALYGIGINRAQSEQPLQASVTIPGPLYSTLQQQQQSLSTPISPSRQYNAFNYNTSSNFIQQQQQQQQQRRHIIQNQNSSLTGAAAAQQSMTSATSNLTSNYNYSAEQATNGAVYANQTVPLQSAPLAGSHVSFASNNQPINFLNNDPSYPVNNHSAGPIFMHHHNNNIGGIGQHQSQHAGNINNSNSNLLHQNTTSSPTSSTAVTVAGALNNQVAPGTRANNYWDNFRSYSRQNLLSSNSCKSNEELNHQMHQQHLQQQQVQQHLLHQQQQQPINAQMNNSSTSFNLSPIPSTNNINLQNECRPLSSVSVVGPTSSTNLSLNVTNTNNTLGTINSNNLNPSNYENKYFHTFRNEFNSNNQHHASNSTIQSNAMQPLNLSSIPNAVTAAALNVNSTLNTEHLSNFGNNQTSTVPFNNNINGIQHLEVNQGGSASSNLSVGQSDNLNENIFDFNSISNNNNININNNINSSSNNTSNVASFFGSPDFRNMNFNFGLHEPKKVPMKAACNASTKRIRHTQSAPNNTLNLNDPLGHNNSIGNNSSQSSHNVLNHQNNDHRYEEMGDGAMGFDETSEEIKRNLLVNALKSDKFTSKFFESLKEDVYRQAYAIIQEKKSDPKFLFQLFEEIKGAPAYDPLRNMLIQSFYNSNISTSNQHRRHHRTNNDTESNDGDNEMENEETSPAVTSDVSTTVTVVPESNSTTQNCYKIDDINLSTHNFQPDLKLNSQSNVLPDGLYHRNSIPNVSNNDNLRDCDIKSLFFNTKDYKFPNDSSVIQQKKKSNDMRNEKINQQYQTRNFVEPRTSNDTPRKRPESHIISYTIFKIRKEIQKQHIDDATLLKIVKITIQTLEDAIINLQQPSPVLAASLRSLLYRIKLSTKEVFTKMKSFQNHEKDNFLANYQCYLNKLLVEDSNNINLAKSTRYSGEGGDTGFWQVTDNNQVQNKTSLAFNNQMQWNEVHSLPKQGVNYKSNISTVVGNEAKVLNSSENQTHTVNEIFFNLNQQNVHFSHRHPQNQYQHQHEMGSPCTSSNNMINEDLAEADQICSSNNLVSIEILDKATVENRLLNQNESNSPSIDDVCVGAVGYSNTQNSDDDVGMVLNDKDISTHENINNIDVKDIRQNNDIENNEDSENNIIHNCDNDKVEDDQDFENTARSALLLTDSSVNITHSNDMKKLSADIALSANSKRSKIFNHKSLDMMMPENNENINDIAQITLKNTEDISTDNYIGNNKSNNILNTIINNTNNGTTGRLERNAGFIVGSNTNNVCVTTNNACEFIFPLSVQSDSMINNNLDSGYQSLPQPDSNSSLSNSNTESVESNESSVDLRNTNKTSIKRNSVP